MKYSDAASKPAGDDEWPAAIHDVLEAHQVELCESDPAIRCVKLTTEEEGVALIAGAWLAGEHGVVLMQSSGVGNCINLLASLTIACQFPLTMIVTMRGEWGEGNPWQIPMAQTIVPLCATMGISTVRADRAEDVAPSVDAMLGMAYRSASATAVLIGQRLIGAKSFKD